MRLPDPAEVAGRLYAPRGFGAMVLEDVVSTSERQALITDTRGLPLRHVPLEGTVRQDMYTHYWAAEDSPSILDMHDSMDRLLAKTPLIHRLWRQFDDWYEKVGYYAGFTVNCINSVGLHRYDKGVEGISPHKDYERSINLVAVYVLQGEAPFYVCDDRDGNGRTDLNARPGDLVLLRANREQDRSDMRPFHGVGKITETRYSLCLREERA